MWRAVSMRLMPQLLVYPVTLRPVTAAIGRVVFSQWGLHKDYKKTPPSIGMLPFNSWPLLIAVVAALRVLLRFYAPKRILSGDKALEDRVRKFTSLRPHAYRIPPTLLTPMQFFAAPYTYSAPKINFKTFKVLEKDNFGSYFDLALCESFYEKCFSYIRPCAIDGAEASHAASHGTIPIAIILPQFGATQYTRCVRRIIAKLEAKKFACAVVLPRLTRGDHFPVECDPTRNSFLCNDDIYLAMEFISMHLLKYTAPSGGPLTIAVEFHLVGLSIGSMRVVRVLCDEGRGPRLERIVRSLQNEEAAYVAQSVLSTSTVAVSDLSTQKEPALIETNPSTLLENIGMSFNAQLTLAGITVASGSALYATFDKDVIMSHSRKLQVQMAEFLKEITIEHRDYFEKWLIAAERKHLEGKGSSEADVAIAIDQYAKCGVKEIIDEVLRDGRLMVLDNRVSSRVLGFVSAREYYDELLPTRHISDLDNDIPILFFNAEDDRITGSYRPLDLLLEKRNVVYVEMNRGGHLGTVMRDGTDVCSRCVAEWVTLNTASPPVE